MRSAIAAAARSDTGRQKEGEDQGREARIFEKVDGRHDLAALDEAVAGGQFGQQVEAPHDLGREAVEIVAGGRFARIEPHLVPARHQLMDLFDDGLLVIEKRAPGRDRQILAEGFRQVLDLCVDRRAFLLESAGPPDHLLVHLGEIEACRATEINRHQRPVIELDDKPAGALQDKEAIATEHGDQQAHCNERAEYRGADRSLQAHPHGQSAFPIAVETARRGGSIPRAASNARR